MKTIREYFAGLGVALFICSLPFGIAVAGGLVSWNQKNDIYYFPEESVVYELPLDSNLTPV